MKIGLFFLLLAFYLQSSGWADFSFSENIAEAQQSGRFLLSRGKAEDALLEFENIVLMDEGNVYGLVGFFYFRKAPKQPRKIILSR
jgi:hypothetical protein